jgi:hypothetical protein
MYFKDEESINHVFSECKFIKEVRQYIHDETWRYRQTYVRYRKGHPLKKNESSNLLFYLTRTMCKNILKKKIPFKNSKKDIVGV